MHTTKEKNECYSLDFPQLKLLNRIPVAFLVTRLNEQLSPRNVYT